MVYDTRGPFPEEAASPTWRAGIRVGDRIDLSQMRCIPVDTATCATVLAVIGGLQYVNPGRTARLSLKATPDHPAPQVELVAEQPPVN